MPLTGYKSVTLQSITGTLKLPDTISIYIMRSCIVPERCKSLVHRNYLPECKIHPEDTTILFNTTGNGITQCFDRIFQL